MADSDDWRVTLSVTPAQQSTSLRQLEDDIRRQVGRGIAVGLGDTQIFLYADTETAADLATDVVFHLTQGVGLLRRAHGDGDAPVIAVCHGTTLARGSPQ